MRNLKNEQDYLHESFQSVKPYRFGGLEDPKNQPRIRTSSIDGLNRMTLRLKSVGGPSQQSRMIRDKRRSLDRAVLYSYQGAFIKKDAESVFRALINPDKLKQDYDDKIVSVGFEAGFTVGDVFEWLGTNTFWLIYLQDLNERAYFRGEIRRCTYEISWKDENGELKRTFAAVRGPVETKINYIQKHKISVDEPNYSLNILMPLTDDTKKYFKRYSKFYLQNDDICWRVEATDWISTPGILNVVAVEYYANEAEDDIENGIAGGLIMNHVDTSSDADLIQGEGFIKPKKEYIYTIRDETVLGEWSFDQTLPIEAVVSSFEIKLRWVKNYSGQFDLNYGDYTKTIVVESLF